MDRPDKVGRFGKWTVETRAPNGKHGEVYWFCRCDCGVQKRVLQRSLWNGSSVSCGCSAHDVHRKHGLEGTPVYGAWAAMLQRCRNPKNQWFHRYGGRGITVCERWNDFRNFYADMGDKPPGGSLERENNDRGYEPGNCRWATHTEQMRNRGVTLTVEFQGAVVSVAELAERHGLSRKLVGARLARGLSVEDALKPGKFSRWHPVN